MEWVEQFSLFHIVCKLLKYAFQKYNILTIVIITCEIMVTITFLVYNLCHTFSPKHFASSSKMSYFSLEIFYFFLKMSYFSLKMSYFSPKCPTFSPINVLLFSHNCPTFFLQLSYSFCSCLVGTLIMQQGQYTIIRKRKICYKIMS